MLAAAGLSIYARPCGFESDAGGVGWGACPGRSWKVLVSVACMAEGLAPTDGSAARAGRFFSGGHAGIVPDQGFWVCRRFCAVLGK